MRLPLRTIFGTGRVFYINGSDGTELLAVPAAFWEPAVLNASLLSSDRKLPFPDPFPFESHRHHTINQKQRALRPSVFGCCGSDGTRTRDLLRDRQTL